MGILEVWVLNHQSIIPSFHYSNLLRPACNLAVRLDAIAICHKAHWHSKRVARVANSSLPINDDQTAGAAGFFCQQDNRLVCRCVRISSAFQKFKSRFSHYNAHDRFAVASARNPAQLVSVGSAAEQGRVAHSSRKFVEDTRRWRSPPRPSPHRRKQHSRRCRASLPSVFVPFRR